MGDSRDWETEIKLGIEIFVEEARKDIIRAGLWAGDDNEKYIDVFMQLKANKFTYDIKLHTPIATDRHLPTPMSEAYIHMFEQYQSDMKNMLPNSSLFMPYTDTKVQATDLYYVMAGVGYCLNELNQRKVKVAGYSQKFLDDLKKLDIDYFGPKFGIRL